MKTVLYTQKVYMWANIPDDVEETEEAIIAYFDENDAWPNVTEGEWDSELIDFEVVKRAAGKA
jgi:hypothetical protein